MAGASGGRRRDWAKRSREAEEEAKKKNAIVLSFTTWDASHEARSQEERAGREERGREQQ